MPTSVHGGAGTIRGSLVYRWAGAGRSNLRRRLGLPSSAVPVAHRLSSIRHKRPRLGPIGAVRVAEMADLMNGSANSAHPIDAT